MHGLLHTLGCINNQVQWAHVACHGDRNPNKVKANNIRKLFSEPLTHWGDATHTFNDHICVQTGALKRGSCHSTSGIYNSYLESISQNVHTFEKYDCRE